MPRRDRLLTQALLVVEPGEDLDVETAWLLSFQDFLSAERHG